MSQDFRIRRGWTSEFEIVFKLSFELPRTALDLTMSMLSVVLVISKQTESSLSDRILTRWVSLNQLKVIADSESNSMDNEISFGSDRDS